MDSVRNVKDYITNELYLEAFDESISLYLFRIVYVKAFCFMDMSPLNDIKTMSHYALTLIICI
jgi:hypothetical protein